MLASNASSARSCRVEHDHTREYVCRFGHPPMSSTGRRAATPVMRWLSLSAIWLVVSVLFAGPAAAQALSRTVLVLDQSSAGLPFNTALATAIRTTLNAH